MRTVHRLLLAICPMLPGCPGGGSEVRLGNAVDDADMVGFVDHADLARAVAGIEDDLRDCVRSGAEVRVDLVIDPEGIASFTLEDPVPAETALCLQDTLGRGSFPRPEWGQSKVAVAVRR